MSDEDTHLHFFGLLLIYIYKGYIGVDTTLFGLSLSRMLLKLCFSWVAHIATCRRVLII